LLLGTWKSR